MKGISELIKATLRASIAMAVMVAMIAQSQIPVQMDSHYYKPKVENPIFLKIPSQNSTLGIDDLLVICSDVNRSPPTKDCLETLSKYFMSDPIWLLSEVDYQYFSREMLEYMLLNPRSKKLDYEYGDYGIAEVPSWKDIFDGEIKRRVEVIGQVLKEDECRGLLADGIGIRLELSEQCSARELVKYAAFLDACVTSTHRSSKMSNMSKRHDGEFRTSYETGLRNIAGKWTDPDLYRMAKYRFVVTNLRAAWVSYLCKDTPNRPITAFDEIPNPRTPSKYHRPGSAYYDIPAPIREAHNTLLKMAARAGDEWALVSYYPEGESAEYLSDLYELKPILVHRYLASSAGFGRGMRVKREARLQHRVKAYLMLKEQHPNNNRLDWDLTTHPAAFASWEHIKAGRPLKFPWK